MRRFELRQLRAEALIQIAQKVGRIWTNIGLTGQLRSNSPSLISELICYAKQYRLGRTQLCEKNL